MGFLLTSTNLRFKTWSERLKDTSWCKMLVKSRRFFVKPLKTFFLGSLVNNHDQDFLYKSFQRDLVHIQFHFSNAFSCSSHTMMHVDEATQNWFKTRGEIKDVDSMSPAIVVVMTTSIAANIAVIPYADFFHCSNYAVIRYLRMTKWDENKARNYNLQCYFYLNDAVTILKSA